MFMSEKGRSDWCFIFEIIEVQNWKCMVFRYRCWRPPSSKKVGIKALFSSRIWRPFSNYSLRATAATKLYEVRIDEQLSHINAQTIPNFMTSANLFMAILREVTHKVKRKKNRINHETGNVLNASMIKSGNVSLN